jgi:tetratricopeptide (TPR) repeat protein
VQWSECQAGQAADALRRALQSARRTSRQYLVRRLELELVRAVAYGAAPIDENIRSIEAAISDAGEGVAHVLPGILARARAAQGRFEEARQLAQRAVADAFELGLTVEAAARTQVRWYVEWFGGDFAAAEEELRSGIDRLAELGETSYRSTTLINLANVVYELGRDDEALELCELGDALTNPGDLVNVAGSFGVRAKLLARRGEHDGARAAAKKAWDIATATDFYPLRTYVLEAQAVVLLAAGDRDGAADARAAVSEWRRKGALVLPIPLQHVLAQLQLPESV